MKKNNPIKILSFIVILATTISCSSSQKKGPRGMAGQISEYKVMKVKPQSTTLYQEYPTNLEGIQTVEIRPKIAGYIQNILVDEGSFVKKGQVLFRINDNDIRATVRSAQAQVKVAEADVVAAKINLNKTKPLVEKGIISKFDLESSESMLKAKEAQLAQAKANLANAQANLQYAIITSPTNGIIGNFPYRIGSLVSSNIPQPLTTVSNTTEMYAYFSMNEKEFLTMIKGLKGNNLQAKFRSMPAVSLILADNSVYGEKGRIQTASGLVDPQTGSVNIRATFPNKEGILRSGGSGLVRISQHVDSVIIVPQNATYELQGKHFIYTVGDENKVHPTEIGILAGNLKNTYVVTSGLKPGDEIVVEGIASLRNNMPIKPKLVTQDSSDDKKDSGAVVNN
ncbi:efflux RND transporter periplasmic adaptor subunit [Prolixibacter sp. SD074]|jgi:membrane fusion protein (multidrug efflux system)|uniref:efflux RND transporter periplasmic adaptor subunit n=1 Tax=Prolixibacter sp. SD074 TaxID=2652391 RepID=UPI00127C077D|nr:efflux RND transporter periplasmic adaptor subunit [Prolixibacter sp. SD074]GET29716.1 hemolysin D [Prolixibacter sp. SD074]